jgi:hypothetical protein
MLETTILVPLLFSASSSDTQDIEQSQTPEVLKNHCVRTLQSTAGTSDQAPGPPFGMMMPTANVNNGSSTAP